MEDCRNELKVRGFPSEQCFRSANHSALASREAVISVLEHDLSMASLHTDKSSLNQTLIDELGRLYDFCCTSRAPNVPSSFGRLGTNSGLAAHISCMVSIVPSSPLLFPHHLTGSSVDLTCSLIHSITTSAMQPPPCPRFWIRLSVAQRGHFELPDCATIIGS